MPALRLRWRTAPARLAVLALAVAALLSGCAGTPQPGAAARDKSPPAPVDASRDGPPAEAPADLAQRPDPEPRVEPIRSGGPNKPYAVLGQHYTPLSSDVPLAEQGLASWYGRKFHGRPTASGEIYDMYAVSAAHRTMPIPSYARVRNPANGREVVVRINDRGPFHADRIIDLSYAAALKLGVLRGVAPVEVRRLTHEDIRSERWRADTALVQAAPPAPLQAAAPAPAAALAPVTSAPAALEQPGAGAASGAAVGVVPADAPVPAAAPAAAVAGAPRYWLQVGAFRQREGAFELRRQLMRDLAWLEPWLAVFDDSALFKVQAGPFASRSEALGAAERLRGAAAVQATVVRRR